jgi:hypothetical protein
MLAVRLHQRKMYKYKVRVGQPERTGCVSSCYLVLHDRAGCWSPLVGREPHGRCLQCTYSLKLCHVCQISTAPSLGLLILYVPDRSKHLILSFGILAILLYQAKMVTVSTTRTGCCCGNPFACACCLQNPIKNSHTFIGRTIEGKEENKTQPDAS